ncbi:hypothetical protein [Cronobacter dublinensis]|uniref:hypothetical protein n=1 Tax=Cronobacter dublinensis TaxID=413497 RepID=UPI0005195091|nr:hypothetical protein [Cronobacter dublinensis]MDI6442255.1 hypothetical protein [Cronobacter dublinensis]
MDIESLIAAANRAQQALEHNMGNYSPPGIWVSFLTAWGAISPCVFKQYLMIFNDEFQNGSLPDKE